MLHGYLADLAALFAWSETVNRYLLSLTPCQIRKSLVIHRSLSRGLISTRVLNSAFPTSPIRVDKPDLPDPEVFPQLLSIESDRVRSHT